MRQISTLQQQAGILNIASNFGSGSDAGATIAKERTDRAAVRFWLYGVCLLIFAMIVVGGATRLTDSGLSITEWRPIHGTIPPLDPADWETEFEKYRQIPEYRQINRGMTLAQFKKIYWWEWSHRQLGRLIGLAVAVPLAFFWLTDRLESRLKPRLVALFALGGIQGAIGWWMVKSGLAVRTDVSQIRLAVHLTLACAIFAYALWIARALAPHHGKPEEGTLRVLLPIVALCLFGQIFLGGLVAGLDAGLAFNDWPTMDGAWVPSGLVTLEPVFRNLLDNPKASQFAHRVGAYALFVIVLIQWLAAAGAKVDTRHRRRALILLLLVTLQMAIGVATLVHQVPLPLALIHQAGAVVVLAFTIAHWRALYGAYPPRTAIEIRR